MSFVNDMNRKGPMIDPCGTQEVNFAGDDVLPEKQHSGIYQHGIVGSSSQSIHVFPCSVTSLHHYIKRHLIKSHCLK